MDYVAASTRITMHSEHSLLELSSYKNFFVLKTSTWQFADFTAPSGFANANVNVH